MCQNRLPSESPIKRAYLRVKGEVALVLDVLSDALISLKSAKPPVRRAFSRTIFGVSSTLYTIALVMF